MVADAESKEQKSRMGRTSSGLCDWLAWFPVNFL